MQLALISSNGWQNIINLLSSDPQDRNTALCCAAPQVFASVKLHNGEKLEENPPRLCIRFLASNQSTFCEPQPRGQPSVTKKLGLIEYDGE